jgi:ethanolamine utilization protein EutN
MLQGTVVGNVWSTKRIDGLPSGAFLEVEVAGSGERLVAFDVLGSGQGERVLVAQGSVAAGWLPGKPPVDALIIGSIDEPSAPLTAPPAAPPADEAAAPSPARAVNEAAAPPPAGPADEPSAPPPTSAAGSAAPPVPRSPRAKSRLKKSAS